MRKCRLQKALFLCFARDFVYENSLSNFMNPCTSLRHVILDDPCVRRLTPRATWAWSLVREGGTQAGAWYLVPRPFWPAGLCTTCPTCPANMSTHCFSAIRQANFFLSTTLHYCTTVRYPRDTCLSFSITNLKPVCNNHIIG